jgi:alanyl-tRNA synthetase
MTRRSCQQIRNDFLQFFRDRGHTFVPSSSLLPADDPTLLFANAGMNQFKAIFLGAEKRDYARAVNSQKCIRAGGKHNDLEDVGRDTYHHTFFEMLGNWSFGDYFKEDAIRWAWQLLTEVWGLPKDRLHATVFGGDETEGLAADTEAMELWKKVTDIDHSHIHLGSKKDNFWEMGETGPCGPCSEIHIDLTPDRSGAALVNASDARVIEIWNLVFMQYNRGSDGKLSPLPATHVDTGMGFERICFVLQGKHSNYATDLFVPLIKQIETLTSHRYGQSTGIEDRFDATDCANLADVAFRVVADHARTLTFAIADGVLPSNEGRGYVLRRILRRAARYGRQYLGIEGAFLVKLVPTIVEMMGEAFGELRARQKYVIETILGEEESFGRTLDRGLELFGRKAGQIKQSGSNELPGETAFSLYATYGFPIDLTQIMANELGMTVDITGYNAAMEEHRKLSSSADAFKMDAVANLPATDDSAKYSPASIEAKVLGWVIDGSFVREGGIEAPQAAALVLDRTNFYGEQGGQVGDTGSICFDGGEFVVENTTLTGQCVLHHGRMKAGGIKAGAAVSCRVADARFDIMRNHTATHLLNWALRGVLGEHVNQAGSIVSAQRLRFDFTHNQALSSEELVEVERRVNNRILADLPVRQEVMALDAARQIAGVRAVFGEKYPDPVRVITVGDGSDASVEFCGGTHLSRSSQAGLFKIIAEESVAKGVRRITAVTGHAAVACVQEMDSSLKAAANVLRVSGAEVAQRIEAMQKEIKQLRKKAPAGGPEGFVVRHEAKTQAGAIIIGRADGMDVPSIRTLCDVQRQRGAVAVFVGAVTDEKVTLVAMVSDELAKSKKLLAGDWVKAVGPIVGGSGGGKPTLAQAGGRDGSKLDDALNAAFEYAQGRLTS